MQQAGSNRKPVRTFEGHKEYIHSIATFPDGKKIATGSSDKTIRIWRLEDGTEMMKWVVEGSVKALAILPNGRHVVSVEEVFEGGPTAEDCHFFGGIWVHDAAESGRVVKYLDGWGGFLESSLDVSPDGKTLASGGSDCRVNLWDTTTWQRKGAPLSCHGASRLLFNRVNCVQFSPSGQLAIATDQDIQIWDLRRRECVAQFKNYRNGGPCNHSLTWTRDGAHLLSTGTHLISVGAQLLSAAREVPKLFRSWDTSTWEEAGHSWIGHSQRIILNPAGTLLASASEFTSGTIQLWHLLTGKEVAKFQHSHRVFFVAFSVDGHFIFSAGADKKILQWKIPDEALTTASSDSPLVEGENNVGPSPGKQKESKSPS